MPNASDNSDYSQPFGIRLARIAKGDAFTERVSIRPLSFSQRLVNNHNSRPLTIVGFTKETSPQPRCLQHSEIIRCDTANLFVRPRFAFTKDAAFDRKRGIGIRAAQWKNGCETCCFDSRQLLDPAQCFVPEIDHCFALSIVGAFSLRVFRVRKSHFSRQNVATIKSCIDALNPRVTFHYKTSVNEHHQRKRDLDDE